MRLTKSMFSLALATAALAGCGQAATDTAPGGDPAKAAAEVAFQFQPGKYRTTIDFQKFDLPGMPAAQLEQMKAMMAKKSTSEYCVSPEQSGKGIEVMKEQMGKGQCQFEKFDASGGKVETVFSCSPGAGMTLKAVSKGEYSATGSKVNVTSDMAMPGGKTIHVEQTITMERIGDCT